MTDDNVEQLSADARVELQRRLTATPPDIRRLARRALARRRALTGMAAVFVVGAIAVALVLRDHDGASQIVAGAPDERTIVVDLMDLRGRVVSVALPPSLADGFQIVKQTAGLTVDRTSWRVDVTRTSQQSAMVTDGCAPAPTAVIGMVGPWTVTLTGDGMTSERCEFLRQQITSFEERPNGILAYRGSGTLDPIDGPDVLAATGSGRLYLFHRSCSQPTETRTRSGLTVARVDDPARGATLTVLCSRAADVEIWFEAPQWPAGEEIDAIAIR